MVSGRLQCLGSCQHLKSRFGTGYQLDISTESEDKRRGFVQFCQSQTLPFGEILIEEEHSHYVRIKLANNDLDLAVIFTLLERLKTNDQMILDYSLSQSTLEQIFINFAKEQEEEKPK
jgi:hypothetical protein